MCVSGRMMIKQVVRKSNINNIFASMIITPTFKGEMCCQKTNFRETRRMSKEKIFKKK